VPSNGDDLGLVRDKRVLLGPYCSNSRTGRGEITWGKGITMNEFDWVELGESDQVHGAPLR
jgi:hypothetical protein